MATTTQSTKQATAKKSKKNDMYTPRVKPAPAVKAAPAFDPMDKHIKKIVAKTLEDLKLPGAIPSKIIEAALKEARAL